MKVINSDNGLYTNLASWESGTTFQPMADKSFNIELDDGLIIKTAGFQIQRTNNSMVEFHACVSTQAGCKLACQMCLSGKNGFDRNLTAEEIIHQVKVVEKSFGAETLDHIVFMGIGEPLDNYTEFTSALRQLNAQGYEGKLSFASAGLVNHIRQFADEMIPIRMLWLSLHAATDEKRKEIMPIARAYSLKQTLDSGLYLASKTKAEVRVNYLLYKGFNDSEQDAMHLANLLAGTEQLITVQLTQPNDVPFGQYEYADQADIIRFNSYLKKYGLKNKTMRFLAAGKPLKAGCGEFTYTSAK